MNSSRPGPRAPTNSVPAVDPGQAAATWGLHAGEVVLEPFGRLTRAHGAALAAEAKDVTRYLGSRSRA